MEPSEGARRAAEEIAREYEKAKCHGGASASPWHETLAEIIDRETHSAEMRKALEAAKLLFAKGHALDHFDWGTSRLTAEDIAELNDLPSKIEAALKGGAL